MQFSWLYGWESEPSKQMNELSKVNVYVRHWMRPKPNSFFFIIFHVLIQKELNRKRFDFEYISDFEYKIYEKKKQRKKYIFV